MKRTVEIITQITALSAVAIGTVYLFSIIAKSYPIFWEAINSQFFTAILTLLVGFIAYLLYLKQKRDHKRDIASLILQEIRHAEQRIREARERDNTYKLADELLPTNSWHNNIHLFISVLGESGADTISRFYSRTQFLDYIIRKIADEKAFPTNQAQGTPVIIQPSPQSTPISGGIPSPQPAQIQIAIDNSGQAQAILAQVSQEVEFIYNSPAVDLLRKIANE